MHSRRKKEGPKPEVPSSYNAPSRPRTDTKKLAEEGPKAEDPSSDKGMASAANGQRSSESKLPEANVPKSMKKKKKKKVQEGPNLEESSSSDDTLFDYGLGRLRRKPFFRTKPTPEELAEHIAIAKLHRDAKLPELCKKFGYEYPFHDDDRLGRKSFWQPRSSSDSEEDHWEDIGAPKHPNLCVKL